MKAPRFLSFWSKWGLIPRLMAAVGFASLMGGGIQNYLLVLEGAAEHSARHEREVHETLRFLAPLVADQAVLGDYAAIGQLLRNQAKKVEIGELTWTDKNGRKLVSRDEIDKREAPAWFNILVPIAQVKASLEVEAGGANYGTLRAEMNSVPASNRLWAQFVHQLQIVVATLLLMLQFIWLIFRGNLGTLRNLAVSANRFSQGDHAVRVEADGAPEVRAAADAFNNMANNIESLIASLGESETNNRRLAAIVKQSSEAIWTRDLSGRITTWNAGAAVLFGYTAEEAIGNFINVDVITTPEEEGRRLDRLKSGETFSYETRALTRSGRELDIEVAAAPLHDENSHVVGKICVAHDVTQRKRAQEELHAAREAAEAANKAKSTFLAKMSHEIRTPMNGVLGMTELLLETGLTSTQRKYAETVQRSGRSLLAIINDILDFSKIEAGKLDLEHIEFDLRQTVEDAVELLAERAQSKGLELECSLPVDVSARLKGDPLRLGQVLTNLIGNAIKFTESGEVSVAVSRLEETDDTLTLRFEVTDTGPGIDKDAQARIFENFSQADGTTTRKHGGTGLGLAISKQLVEMMGGTMHVESTPGEGSTFWFAVRFDKHAADAHDTAFRNKLHGVRALIAAPSATTRTAMNAQMTNWGMVNRAVEGAVQALETLADAAARRAPYDVVVIDSALAGIGAIGLAKAIKANAMISETRIVMLMPVGRHGDAREARHAGVLMCLSKPVRQSALYNALLSVMTGTGDKVVDTPPPAPLAGVTPRRHGGKLLLAEDNPVNQQVALAILKIEGYEVTVAKNGREAVDAYSTGNFDLILMDCHMPEMDGFEATRNIRLKQKQDNRKRIPIIALTANAMQQDREECLNAGMDDHLSKPYTRLQIRATLDRWLQQEGPAEPAATGGASHSGVAPAAQQSVLDRAVLQDLRALDNGESQVLKQVIGTYLADTPGLIEQMREAVHGMDLAAAAQAAHTLKSASANVGAVEFAQICSQLESAARADALEETKRLADVVSSGYRAVERALAAERELASA